MNYLTLIVNSLKHITIDKPLQVINKVLPTSIARLLLVITAIILFVQDIHTNSFILAGVIMYVYAMKKLSILLPMKGNENE